MLVLDNGSSIGGQSTFFKVGEHKEKVDAWEKLHHCITKKLQPLIMADAGCRLLLSAKAWHDVDQGIDACNAETKVQFTHNEFPKSCTSEICTVQIEYIQSEYVRSVQVEYV